MRIGRVILLLVLFCALAAGEKNRGVKVYISADLEGVAGVVDNTQASPSGRDYALGRRLMMAEVNAAIAAALDAGATEVIVNDSHWDQTNLEPDKLDPRARLITGAPKPFGMMQGLDDSFAAVLFIGYHPRGSTADGVLDHTYSSELKVVKLNGHEVGEYGLNAALAGHYGVPVIFISGDRAATEQAKEFIPGVEVAAVKQGIGRTAALTLPPDAARQLIAEGVKRAMGRRSEIKPVSLRSPITLEVELSSSRQADSCMMVPGMKRVSGRTVSYTAPDMAVIYQVSRLISRLSPE
ncbi:MAG: M55 family metallopeptidase [Terriglobales bacterium]